MINSINYDGTSLITVSSLNSNSSGTQWTSNSVPYTLYNFNPPVTFPDAYSPGINLTLYFSYSTSAPTTKPTIPLYYTLYLT